MKAYKISCYSKCGTFYCNYLQSVTVVAASEEEAKRIVTEWCKNGKGAHYDGLLYGEDKWEVQDLGEIVEGTVLDFHMGTDY